MADTLICYPDGQQLEPWFRVWFDEKFCQGIATWGQCVVFPDCSAYAAPLTDEALGHWSFHFDVIDPLSEEAAKEPWKLLDQLLPGTRLKYTDRATGQSWVWVLTDDVNPSRGVRLGLWRD